MVSRKWFEQIHTDTWRAVRGNRAGKRIGTAAVGFLACKVIFPAATTLISQRPRKCTESHTFAFVNIQTLDHTDNLSTIALDKYCLLIFLI